MTAERAELAPAQVKGTVLTVRRVDAYHAMTVIAPGVAARFRPGQFVAVAAGADRVFGALTARRSGRSAVITTEDGSLGARGQVTDLLTQVIHEARTDVIYACGPMGMLRAVTALAGRYDIPVQVLVEESMACGTGVCMTCVLPVVGEDGVTRMARSCVDGPVFRGDLVRWDDIGTIPFDALGAPGWKPRAQPKAERPGHGR